MMDWSPEKTTKTPAELWREMRRAEEEEEERERGEMTTEYFLKCEALRERRQSSSPSFNRKRGRKST